jgi:hypothetical protein
MTDDAFLHLPLPRKRGGLLPANAANSNIRLSSTPVKASQVRKPR